MIANRHYGTGSGGSVNKFWTLASANWSFPRQGNESDALQAVALML